MWKSIGSVHSGEDKSVRSNRSREEVRFEPFRQALNRRSQISPEANRSFCCDYLQKVREDSRNRTYNSRAKSQQKSLKSADVKQDDMFTSMRNILTKEEGIASKIEEKNVESQKNPEQSNDKNLRVVKQAHTRLKNLKRDHGKLKETIQNEFAAFKNYFYQFEQMSHSQQQKQPSLPSDSPQNNSEFILEILQQAVNVQHFFQEMQKKKALIMQKLSRQE